MSNSYGFGGEEIREESSWRYPLGIFVATLLLCAVFLYHYVGPSVDDLQGSTPNPTISEERVRITVGDRIFFVPANHTIYPKDRREKVTEDLHLYAIWPTMNGYTPARRQDFIEDEPGSRRIDVQIRRRDSVFSEQQRLEQLYLPHVVDKAGQPGDYQLTQFTFKEARANAPTNGYAGKDMYMGEAADGELLVLFCYKDQEEKTIPSQCYRRLDFSENVSIRYAFDRAYLPDWREIDTQVRRFIITLTDAAGA